MCGRAMVQISRMENFEIVGSIVKGGSSFISLISFSFKIKWIQF